MMVRYGVNMNVVLFKMCGGFNLLDLAHLGAGTPAPGKEGQRHRDQVVSALSGFGRWFVLALFWRGYWRPVGICEEKVTDFEG